MVDFKKLNRNSEKPAESTPESSTETSKNEGIYRDFLTGRLSVYQAGSFTIEDGPKKGQVQDFKKGMKIKFSGQKEPCKVTARELIALYFLINDDEILRAELRKRQEEEKQNEKMI